MLSRVNSQQSIEMKYILYFPKAIFELKSKDLDRDAIFSNSTVATGSRPGIEWQIATLTAVIPANLDISQQE
jgi:hypothetical protein